jgi:3-oxoacyl-[acyl-carrier protein] reductase
MEENNHLAMVTGAAGVLGLAIAKSFINNNYRVVLIDLDQGKLDEISDELGRLALPIALDISDPQAVKDTCRKVRLKYGDVSVLVNNAGILSNNKLENTSDEEWQKILSINLSGAFYLCRECLPGMKAQRWGRIINISSLVVKTGGLTAGTGYAASKGGMTTLTLSIARESAPFGVTANGIAPAYINTPMVTDFLSDEQKQELLNQIPVGRFCEAEEVAHLVNYLASPLSGFVTGEIIDINGGLHMD